MYKLRTNNHGQVEPKMDQYLRTLNKFLTVTNVERYVGTSLHIYEDDPILVSIICGLTSYFFHLRYFSKTSKLLD